MIENNEYLNFLEKLVEYNDKSAVSEKVVSSKIIPNPFEILDTHFFTVER